MLKQELSCKQKIKCEIGQYAEKKEYFKEHYKKKCLNKEYSDKQKEYYEKNKERVKENAKLYLNKLKDENPDKLKEYRHRAYLKRKEKMSNEVA
jgi:hypothetical protein